jgi:RNA polymerase sigma factor (sigma-70 family)
MWKNNIDLASVTNLRPYLLKGLRRQIINILELKYSQMDKVKIEENLSIEFSPEDYYIQSQVEEELRNKVLDALNNLSRKQREAIYLRFFEDLGYLEIAEIMNINLQSAKNNVQRGLDSLRDVLSAVLFFYLLRILFR